MSVKIDLSYVSYKNSPEASELSRKASKRIWLMLFFSGAGLLGSVPVVLTFPFGYVHKVSDPVGGIIFFSVMAVLSSVLLYYGLRVYPKKINKQIDDILARNKELDQKVHDIFN